MLSERVPKKINHLNELVNSIANHSVLATSRGEKEGILSIQLEIETDRIFARYQTEFMRGDKNS